MIKIRKLINEKIYKLPRINFYYMIPSDPTGSLDDFFLKFFGGDYD
jgi:hypothetical protein